MSYKLYTCEYDSIPEDFKGNFYHDKYGYETYMVMECDGKINVESDSMEPEDAVFFRDLSWIEAWIDSAYQQGFKDGAND